MPLRPLHIAAAIAATALTALGPAHAFAQVPAPTGGATFGDTGGLSVQPGTFLGTGLRISGTLASAAGKPVRIERQDPQTDEWLAVARDIADGSGAFDATWETDVSGRHALRAVPDIPTPTATTAGADAPSATTTVFRPAKATWYGPGFWGRTTACGVRLTRTTVGVAHKTLPCGTRVAVLLDGRQVELPVIDRGPFAKGMTLDLTQAAAESIGMTQTLRVGWVRLPASTS